MKFLLALAFLTAVCAIPPPGQISASSESPAQLASTEGSGQGNDQIGDAEGTAHPELLSTELENSTESKNIENDEDDDENVSLEDLIKALHSIRNAIQRKIHHNISHYKDSDDFIHVPFKRVPVHEDNANETAADAPQKEDRTSERPGNKGAPQNNSVVPNNTNGNETASGHKPKINITQIKKEIHDKIHNIIKNIFRPWLGNNSIENTVVDNGNISNASRPSAHISSRPEKDGNTNNTATSGPQPGSVPKPEVPQSVEENDESTSESRVRFVNPISSGWYYTRQSVQQQSQQPSLSYRNFPYQTAHHKGHKAYHE